MWRHVLMTIGLTVWCFCWGIEAGLAQEPAQRALNKLAELSRDLKIDPALSWSIERCGRPNAKYDPATRHITLCREMREDVRGAFNRYTYTSASELDQVADDAELFVVFHEVGHALIDVLELPVTGREEDVADQFAVWMLLQGGDAGERAILSTGKYWKLLEVHSWRSPFWDEHSVDAQRSYNLFCWLYGTNPAKHVGLVGQWWSGGYLPKQRADRCKDESVKMLESLNRIMGHRR